MEFVKLSECVMTLSWDLHKFVAALPGALAFGVVKVENNSCVFVRNQNIYVTERQLGEFMKILQCLSKNLVTNEEEQDTKRYDWGEISISSVGTKLQCQVKDKSNFDLNFNLSTFLAFLIAIRRVSYWLVVPTKQEYEIMDFFVRYAKKYQSVEFPKVCEIEEDIREMLQEHDEVSNETKFFFLHFLLNHHCILEFQYNLFCLTTKQ